MKDGDSPTTTVSIPSPSASTTVTKRESSDSGASSGKTGYKFWVLAAILLLAFWSMFTGSVTLKWSTISHLSRFSEDPKFPIHEDVDILEVEEREKLVKNMWDVYTHSATARLPRFWMEAFQAAYEHLVSDVPAVRDAAFSEIAKMSLLSIPLDPLPLESGVLGKEGRLPSKWRKARRQL